MAHFLALPQVLDWRATNKPWEARCPVCATHPRAHSMRQIGWDIERRPIFYSCLAQSLDRYNSSANMLHLQNIMETWAKLERIGRAPADGKWVYVLDLQGFGMRDALDPATGLKTCVIVHKYPERLSKLILLDAPRVFSGLWNILKKANPKPVINIKTRDLPRP